MSVKAASVSASTSVICNFSSVGARRTRRTKESIDPAPSWSSRLKLLPDTPSSRNVVGAPVRHSWIPVLAIDMTSRTSRCPSPEPRHPVRWGLDDRSSTRSLPPPREKNRRTCPSTRCVPGMRSVSSCRSPQSASENRSTISACAALLTSLLALRPSHPLRSRSTRP